MTDRKCRVEDCHGKTYNRSPLCPKHQWRIRAHGSLELTTPEFPERFWLRVEVGRLDECWPWTGCRTKSGYGRVAARSYLGGPLTWNASRVAFTLTFGHIEESAQLDHLCHTIDTDCSAGDACQHRRCVNPWHLEPVTQKENAERRERRLLTCPAGHPKTPENRAPNGASDRCKPCRDEREAERRRVA